VSLIDNERTKLTAAWLNGLATAAAAAGAIAPAAAAFYGVTSGPSAGLRLVLGMAIWIGAGLGLHLAARRVFGRLRP